MTYEALRIANRIATEQVLKRNKQINRKTEKEKLNDIIQSLKDIAIQYEEQSNSIERNTQYNIEIGAYYRGVAVGIDIALGKLERRK